MVTGLFPWSWICCCLERILKTFLLCLDVQLSILYLYWGSCAFTYLWVLVKQMWCHGTRKTKLGLFVQWFMGIYIFLEAVFLAVKNWNKIPNKSKPLHPIVESKGTCSCMLFDHSSKSPVFNLDNQMCFSYHWIHRTFHFDPRSIHQRTSTQRFCWQRGRNDHSLRFHFHRASG